MTVPHAAASAPASMNIQRILSYLPHRYPFLLVDRVVAIEPARHIDAYKCVTINEPFFQGHFPNLPVMPGVLIVEALAQTGALLIMAGEDEATISSSLFLFTGIEHVRFRKPVFPGDRLDMHCEMLRRKLQLCKMNCSAHVAGVLAVEAELTAAMVPRENFQ